MARVLLGNIMGPKGDTGPAGPAGPAGVAGPQGEPGYTPVKGTDYFTEEDIQTLKEYFAPAGYGLGAGQPQLTKEQMDTTFLSGLYWVQCTGTTVQDKLFNYALLRVSGMGNTFCIQELFPLGHQMKLTRLCDGGNWQVGWGLTTWGNDIKL